jgi:hypothetical protein
MKWKKVNDFLSFVQFVGLQLEDEVPDHSAEAFLVKESR